MSKTVNEIVPRAVKAFAEHAITKRVEHDGLRWYRCQQPGKWCMGFDVTLIPGSVVFTGDMGLLALSRCDDMLPWLRGTVMNEDPASISWGYVAEKVEREIETREWSEPEARQAAIEVLAENPSQLDGDEIEDLLRFDCEDSWREKLPTLYDLDPDFWERDVTDYRPRFVYQVMGLRRFVELHDAAVPAPAREANQE